MRSSVVMPLLLGLLLAAVVSPVASASAYNGAHLSQGGTETALLMNAFSATLAPNPAYPRGSTMVTADFAASPKPNLTLTEPLTVLRFDQPMTSVAAGYTLGTVVTQARATRIDPTHWSVDLSAARARGGVLQVTATGAPSATYAATYVAYIATILPTPPPSAAIKFCGDVNLGIAVARWIRATRTTCRRARGLANSLLQSPHDRRIQGYTCKVQPPANPQLRSICRAKGRTVTFLIPRS